MQDHHQLIDQIDATTSQYIYTCYLQLSSSMSVLELIITTKYSLLRC